MGSCRAVFARYGDWRLPTVAEWYTVLGLDHEERKTVLQFGFDRRHWTATERHEGLMHDLPFLRSRFHHCCLGSER